METVFMLSSYIIYTWAASWFFKKRLEITVYKEMVFMAGVFLNWLAGDLIPCFVSVPYFFRALVCQGILTGLVVLLFEAAWQKKIFAASVFLALTTLAADFCESLLCCLSLVFMHRVANVQEPFLDGSLGSLVSVSGVLSAMVILYCSSGHLKSLFDAKSGKWYTTAAVPLISVMIMMDVVNWGATHGILVRSGGNAGVYYDQLFSHTGIIVISGLLALGAGFYLLGLDRLELEQRKSARYYAQVAAYQMLEGQYRQLERLRHDMKNHVIALSELLKNREWEKMGSYLEAMGRWGALGMGGETTGNKVVDAVLGQKKEKAEHCGILWECELQIPADGGIDEFDLCVLFGNLVDNALEECGRLPQGNNRFIQIQGGLVKKCFLLDIKNSASERKDDKIHYGTGLLNVRDIIHKYNGEMETGSEPGIFAVTLLIPLTGAGYDMKQTL